MRIDLRTYVGTRGATKCDDQCVFCQRVIIAPLITSDETNLNLITAQMAENAIQ